MEPIGPVKKKILIKKVADFDGNQMVIRVPLSLEAQTEASLLRFSHMKLLYPTIGYPYFVLTQDMLIGIHVLTIMNRWG